MTDLLDFRNKRLLSYQSFQALKESKNAVVDIIDEDVWASIMSSPDHTSLRTSTHHGTEIKCMYNLWESFFNYMEGYAPAPIAWSVADFSDELQNTIITSMIGLYRLAASSLRSALELAIGGVFFDCLTSEWDYSQWRWGSGNINFDLWCGKLQNLSHISKCEEYLSNEISDSLLKRRNAQINYNGGWVRNLHSRLSNFVHSRPGYHDSDLRKGSGGPLYITETFRQISTLFCEIVSLLHILVKFTDDYLEVPEVTKQILTFPYFKPSKVMICTYQYLWKDDFVKILGTLE